MSFNVDSVRAILDLLCVSRLEVSIFSKNELLFICFRKIFLFVQIINLKNK